MYSFDEIKRMALALSPSERASIAHAVLISLEGPTGLELDEVYEAGIQRRVEWVCSGNAVGEIAEDVFVVWRGA